MTDLAFHFNVADKLHYVCRLIRKIASLGHRVCVVAEPAVLQELDQKLWSFEPAAFVPHVQWPASPEMVHHTPVLLSTQAQDCPYHEVLVNLGETLPAGFERFLRVIEIVSEDPADREAARGRWKHYAQRGYPIQKFEVGSSG